MNSIGIPVTPTTHILFSDFIMKDDGHKAVKDCLIYGVHGRNKLTGTEFSRQPS